MWILEKFVPLKLSCFRKKNKSESIYEHFGFSESSCNKKMLSYLKESNLDINDLIVKKQFLTLDQIPIEYLNNFLKEILNDYSLNLLNSITKKIRNANKILTINDFQPLIKQKSPEYYISFSEEEKKIIIKYCLGNLQSLPPSDKKCEVTCKKIFYRYELACRKILIESDEVYCLYATPSEDSTSSFSDDESDDEKKEYEDTCQDKGSSKDETLLRREEEIVRENSVKDDCSDDEEQEYEESCQDREKSEDETLRCHDDENEKVDKLTSIFKFKIPFLLLVTIGLLKMPKNLNGITNYCYKFFYRNF